MRSSEPLGYQKVIERTKGELLKTLIADHLHSFTITDIYFGVYSTGDDFFILNQLILVTKLFIYKCKLNNTYPSIQVFKAKTKALYHVEKTIANRRNKLTSQFKKWKKFLTFVSSKLKGCPAYASNFT